MEWSPWESNSCSASNEIHCLPWFLKGHYCVHRSQHLSLSWVRWTQPTPFCHTSSRCSPISSYLCLGLQVVSSHQVFCLTIPFFSVCLPQWYLWENIVWSSSLCSFFLYLRSRYCPQHPVLKHLQCMFKFQIHTMQQIKL